MSLPTWRLRSISPTAILSRSPWTRWSSTKAFGNGLAQVVPTEVFKMFSPQELEVLICGNREIDIGLLKQATVYEEVDPESPHVKCFWDALEMMDEQQREGFITFVFARSRLPSSVDRFPMPFRILPPPKI